MTDKAQTIVYARGKYDGVLLSLLTLSLVGNLVLGYSVLANSRQPRVAERQAGTETPKIGTRMEPLELRRLDGANERIQFGGAQSKTVLYVFSPSCGWCDRNVKNLQALTAGATERGFRVIGISLDPNVDAYIRQKQMNFPVYIATAQSIDRYGLRSTPETFVLGGDGTIERHWRGAYAGPTKQEIESWLGRPLPGLTDAAN